MGLLEEYIKKYGNALDEDVLKVDTFLNHQIGAQLMMELAKDFGEHFKDKHITKIATIETNDIAPAVILGYLLQVPVAYFKGGTSRIAKDDLYTCQIHSFTKNKGYSIICSKKYLSADDHILFLDDFMASGEAYLGGVEVLKQANAVTEDIGIVIEKAFQQGRLRVETQGYPMYSQARIASFSQGMITFVSEEYRVAQASIIRNPDIVRFFPTFGMPHTPIHNDCEAVSFYQSYTRPPLPCPRLFHR